MKRDFIDELRPRAMETALRHLYRWGYTPESLGEAQRDTVWWVHARVQAAMNRRPVQRASAIAWTAAGYAELVPSDVPRPGSGHISVRVESSAISPGTERAQYLKLPNASVGLLGRPGYSSAGFVHEVGPKTAGFTQGDRVAITGAAHASLANVPADRAYRMPDGLDFVPASLIHLGIVSEFGIFLSDLHDTEGFVVVGAGPIGGLTQRLAALNGDSLAVIARTESKAEDARRGGASQFLLAERDRSTIEVLSAPVVFEATGNPEALHIAVAAAAEGARIVLVGSPRGVTRDLPIELMREKRIELIGAHIDNVESESAPGGGSLRRHLGERFLQRLADELWVGDLTGPGIDPREAAVFYERLAHDSGLAGAHLDWSYLSDRDRVGGGSSLRVPNVLGRGMDGARPLSPRAEGGIFSPPGDPLAEMGGDLKLGLIGCGEIAVQNAAGISATSNCRIVACFDPVERLSRDLAGRHGADVAPSMEQLLDRSDVDAVVISVPHDLHAPISEAAIEAGKHVVVEKPEANKLASAVAMDAAAKRAGVVLSVCFPQRYEPAVDVARKLIAAGALGRFGGASIRHYLDKTPAYWLSGYSGRTQSDWRSSSKRAGGGVLIMNLSHHIDLVRSLSGAKIESVVAAGGAVLKEMEVEDSISLGIRFDNGAVCNLSGASSVRGTIENEMGLWGDLGHLKIAPKPSVYTMFPIEGLRTNRWTTFGKLPPAKTRAVFFARFADSLARGVSPDVTAEDGLAVQATIEAAYRSLDSGVAERPSDLLAKVKE